MDSVPFKFCDAAAATLYRFPDAGSLHGVWGAAFEHQKTNRLNYALSIWRIDGKWYYKITDKKGNEWNLEELLKAPSKHLRFLHLLFSNGSSSSVPLDTAVTHEEILKVVDFAMHFLNQSAVFFTMTSDKDEKALVECLRLLMDANFKYITFWGGGDQQQYEEFVRKQMRFERLKDIYMLGCPEYCAEELQGVMTKATLPNGIIKYSRK